MKKTKYSKKYVPDYLSKSDKKKQIESIKKKTNRPKLKSAKPKRSSWVSKFEKKYGYKITDKRVFKDVLKKKGFELIKKKGMGAYYSSGSRPNVSALQWGLARVASVILGGASRRIDKDIWEKYRKVKR